MNIFKFIEWAGLTIVIVAFIAQILSRRGYFTNYEREIEYAFLIGMLMWSLAYLMASRLKKDSNNPA